jgi:hypothetical protein
VRVLGQAVSLRVFAVTVKSHVHRRGCDHESLRLWFLLGMPCDSDRDGPGSVRHFLRGTIT